MLSFKPTFSLSTFIKRLFSSSSLSAIRVVFCISEVIDISPGNLDSSFCFFQNSPSVMNNAITEIKHILEGTNSRITEAEERISKVEDRMVEINEAELKKEKNKKK